MSELDDIRALLLETIQIANNNAQAIQANSGAIADLQVLHQQTFAHIDGLTQAALDELGRLSNQADADRTLIHTMQAEVRELQAENRHILERIEQHFSAGDVNEP